jgi:NADH-quinone oxidoreductase subunit L
MAVAWLAISGVPPLAGFWSKDDIMAATFGAGGWHLILWAIGVATALITAFYMTRLMVMTFWGERRWAEGSHPHESPPVMLVPLVLLAAGSALAGLVNTPWRLGLEHFLEPSFEGVEHASTPGGVTAAILIALSVIVALGGIAIAWRRYAGGLPEESGGYWDAALAGYRVDDLYGRLIVAPGLALATWWAVLDLRLIDGIVDGLGRSVRWFADAMRPLQSGLVLSYAVGIAFGAVGLVVLILFGGGAF